MEYIESAGAPSPGCIFCTKPREDDDRANFILHRSQYNFVILNAFPYNNGHLMVIPYQHTASLADLPAASLTEMMQLTDIATRAMMLCMKPDGYNIGMNIGRSAGAGIAEHLHMHVVPRWNGDTNFMPVLGNTRVLPEALDKTWQKLHAAFEETMNAVCKSDGS
jgi:ATP adenylyltransferase